MTINADNDAKTEPYPTSDAAYCHILQGRTLAPSKAAGDYSRNADSGVPLSNCL